MKITLVASGVFSLFLIWWVLLNFFPNFLTDGGALFADTYAVTALLGGVIGLYFSFTRWGGFSSLMGRVVLFLSLGLLAQVFGQASYAFYARVFGIEVPYPSVGDIGFFGSIPLYILGAYYLIRLSTATIRVGKSNKLNPLVIFIPLSMLALSYLVFIKDYEVSTDSLLATALDFGYPLLQSIYVSMALIAFYYTKNMVNSFMHKKILFLLFALVFQYVADFVFLFKAHRDLYVTGGFTDFLYLLAYFLMTLAIINLNDVFERLKSGRINNGAVKVQNEGTDTVTQ